MDEVRRYNKNEIRRRADKTIPIYNGNKHERRNEDRRSGAERQRSSGRGETHRGRRSERNGGQRAQRNDQNRLPGRSKKFSWWKGSIFWKWPWYKWFLRRK
ncbi:hypothetical protein WG954_17085 [Lacibacter sp. H375]|uniref:hypothetical protein n=1 Tax=Lacibacter sp. H375 TaxID=3133424 RepID=UPI0030C46066